MTTILIKQNKNDFNKSAMRGEINSTVIYKRQFFLFFFKVWCNARYLLHK